MDGVSLPIAVAVEALHPMLARRLMRGSAGPLLQHPLICQPYIARHNAIYNRQFHDKRRALQQAMATHNWAKALWLHDRSFRPAALRRIARLMPDKQYWRVLADVWIDAETSFPQRVTWTNLWNARRAHREQVMSDAEHDALAILPESTPGGITIYRGCRERETAQGLSWTISRSQAVRWANHAASPLYMPLLVTATVRKRDVQAYFLERRKGEAEIVMLAKDCRSLTIEALPLHKEQL